jgi:hypothetical protein
MPGQTHKLQKRQQQAAKDQQRECNAEKRVNRVQDPIMIEIRSVVETVERLQHWSKQQEQQQQNYRDFGKSTRHAPPSTEFSIHDWRWLMQSRGQQACRQRRSRDASLML